jgi:hypothetical protein
MRTCKRHICGFIGEGDQHRSGSSFQCSAFFSLLGRKAFNCSQKHR